MSRCIQIIYVCTGCALTCSLTIWTDYFNLRAMSWIFGASNSKKYWFTISPFGKGKKSLHYFTTRAHWHILVILPYKHFTVSWFHHFAILPRCYKWEPMNYNRKRNDKVKMSKQNSNLPIDFYKKSSRDKENNQADDATTERKMPAF